MHREAERLRSFSRRALLLGAGQLALFGALAGRLYYLQVVAADQYAPARRREPHQPSAAAAGARRVLDRNGVPLARNRPTYRVLVIPRAGQGRRARTLACGRPADPAGAGADRRR